MFKSILMCDNTIAPQKESPPDLIKWVYPDCKIEATHILSTKTPRNLNLQSNQFMSNNFTLISKIVPKSQMQGIVSIIN